MSMIKRGRVSSKGKTKVSVSKSVYVCNVCGHVSMSKKDEDMHCPRCDKGIMGFLESKNEE